MKAPVFLLHEELSLYPDLGCATRYTAAAQPGEPGWRVCHGIGKGRSALARKLSAVGEAVERHHFFHSHAHRFGAASELDAPSVSYAQLGLPIDDMSLHKKAQPAGDSECLAWSEATDMTTGENWYVPHEVGGLVRGGYRPTTSGWAAHHATLAPGRALLELVERDAALLSWYCTDFGEEVMGVSDEVLQGIRKLGFEVRMFLLTKDVAVPVIWAWARVRSGYPLLLRGASVMSCASAFLVDDAICSALDGIVQKLENFGKQPSAPFHGVPAHPQEHILYYLSPDAGNKLQALVGEPATVHADQLSSRFTASNGQELSSRLAESGFRALVVDETKDYARLADTSVCRAVVPGLLPMSFGSSESGRLSCLAERALYARCTPVADPSMLPPHPFA